MFLEGRGRILWGWTMVADDGHWAASADRLASIHRPLWDGLAAGRAVTVQFQSRASGCCPPFNGVWTKTWPLVATCFTSRFGCHCYGFFFSFFFNLFFFLTLGCFCFWSMTLRLAAVTRIHSLSIDYRASIQTAAAVLLMLMVSIWWLVSFHSWCRDHQNQIWQWAGRRWFGVCLVMASIQIEFLFQFFFFFWFVLVWFAVWFTTWSWRCTADFAFAFRLCLALKLVVHCPIWSFGFGSVWLSLAVK